MNYSALYYFMNENHSVVEVKLLDIGDDAPKAEKYKWLYWNQKSNSLSQLEFVSQDTDEVNGKKMNVRAFKSGEIRFDDAFAKFMHNGEGHILMNSSQELLPTDLDHKILDYLAK